MEPTAFVGVAHTNTGAPRLIANSLARQMERQCGVYRSILALTFAVLSASHGVAQNCESAVSARAHEDVRQIVQSLHTGDIDVVLKYTHPRVLKLLGGQEAAGRAVESAVAFCGPSRRGGVRAPCRATRG